MNGQHNSSMLCEDSMRPCNPGERALAMWEIVSVVSSLLIAEWVVLPFAGNSKVIGAVPVSLALSLVLLSHKVRGETWHQLGWRTDNFLLAGRRLLWPTIFLAGVLVSIGWWAGSWRFDGRRAVRWMVWQPLWGTLQQYVLQAFFNRRAQILFNKPGAYSVLLVATIFALLHLPNAWLMFATFIGGIVWAAVYQQVPNLPALGLSHGLLSALLASTAPPTAISNLRVGFKFLM